MQFKECSPWAVGCCSPCTSRCHESDSMRVDTLLTDRARGSPFAQPQASPQDARLWSPALVSSPLGELMLYTIVQCWGA